MIRISTYLQPEHKQALIDLAKRQGYVTNDLRYAKGISLFLTDLFTMYLEQEPTTVLYKGRAPHVHTNALAIDMPEHLVSLPDLYNLDSWDQLLANIALGKIRPVAQEGKVELYPRCHYQEDTAQHHNPDHKGQSYILFTTQEAHDLSRALEDRGKGQLYTPDSYRDNRPSEAENKTTGLLQGAGSTLPYMFYWYIPGLDRTRHTLYIEEATRTHLLDIRKHWHIIPPRHRTPASLLAITLETLAHKLLIPDPTLLTQTREL